MKQTAVEWLIEELSKTDQRMLGKVLLIHNQAKQIEKEQIIDAYKADLHPCSDEDAEQYYNETFKQ